MTGLGFFRRVLWAICLVVWLALPGSSAQAQANDNDARSLFARGSEAYSAGDYAEAMRYFEAAYSLSNRPQLLYNLALAADHLRQDEVALKSYRGYLDALPAAENASEIRARIRVLEEASARKEVAPAVATPAEAAKTVMPQESAQPAPQPSETKPIYKRWWLWTAVGVVLAGSATAVLLATRDRGTQHPLPGDNGLVVQTLEAP